MTNYRPLTKAGGRHKILRDALYRFMCEDGGWYASSDLIKIFENGVIRTARGHRYKNGPRNAPTLSIILRRDIRFESRDAKVSGHDKSTYTVKQWRVLK